MAHIQLIGIVEPKSSDGKIWRFPYAFPIIIRQLQKTHHTFELIDTHLHKKSRTELFEFIGTCETKIYGISAYSEGYSFVKQISRKIRQRHKDAIIIVGGILAKSDDVLFKNADVDIAVTSADGEFILPEILDALDGNGRELKDILGITYKSNKDGGIIKNNPRDVMSKERYHRLEMPAYEYFDNEIQELVHNINSMHNEPVKGFPVLTQRGCPFQCTFCGHMYGRKILRKSWSAFFDELEFLVKRYGIQGFFSHDTNMFLNEKDVNDYCQMRQRRRFEVPIVPEMRVTFGNYDMLKKLRVNGIPVVTLGIESGSQKILDIMKKGTTTAQVMGFIRNAVKADVIAYGNFLFGMPGENKLTIKETRRFMLELEREFLAQKQRFRDQRKVCTSGYNYSILIASPNSEIFDVALRDGYINDMNKYLSYLDSEDYSYKYIKGHSRHIGGDLNMSEFCSKQSLIAYVRYSISLVKFKTLVLYEKDILIKLKGITKRAFECAFSYVYYLLTTLKHGAVRFFRSTA